LKNAYFELLVLLYVVLCIHAMFTLMQIMLLTDGDVSNTREVIDLVRKNASNTRHVWHLN